MIYHFMYLKIYFKENLICLIGVNWNLLYVYKPLRPYMLLFLVNYISINDEICDILLEKPQINILNHIINEYKKTKNNQILYFTIINLSLNTRCCLYFLKVFIILFRII